MTQQTRRTSRRWWALAAAATTTLAFTVPAGTALAKKDSDEWVTICHRTNATKNPYVRITVKQSAVDGINGKGEGQGDHYGQHTGPVWTPGMPNGGEWGDIIPPISGVHDGLNWNDAGRAIFEAGCAIVGTADGDQDEDGTPDAQDPDDDNDGKIDTTDPDDDNDGIPDIIDPDADPDGDGDPNATDPDNDNDGTPDAEEPDLDGDGTPDAQDPDDDGDGTHDVHDPDDNGDGEHEDTGNPDTDEDGTPDATDPDDDGDGRPDNRDPDSNGDGLEEDERQPITDPRVPDKIRPGKTATFGPDVTDVGMDVTYRVTCKPLKVTRATPRGDVDSDGPRRLCDIREGDSVVTVRVLGSAPVQVRAVATSAAVATYRGYRQVYVYRVR